MNDVCVWENSPNLTGFDGYQIRFQSNITVINRCQLNLQERENVILRGRTSEHQRVCCGQRGSKEWWDVCLPYDEVWASDGNFKTLLHEASKPLRILFWISGRTGSHGISVNETSLRHHGFKSLRHFNGSPLGIHREPMKCLWGLPDLWYVLYICWHFN